MVTDPDGDEDLAGNEELERELSIQRQIGFAAGIFQEEVTIRALLEALAQGVIVIDSNGIILMVSARAVQMFGYSKNEIIGKPHDILLPERFLNVHAEHMKNYFEAPKTRPMGVGMDLIGLRRDGSEFPVEISLSYIETTHGILVLALVTDITVRKEGEHELSHHAEELRIVNEELEAFAYSVSHDLKAPARAMQGLATILKEDYSGLLDETAKSLVDKIVEGARKMDAIIDDLIKLSRILGQGVKKAVVDISETANAIAHDLHQAEPDRRINIIIQKGMTCRADPGLIAVALTNLLGNAWKYTRNAANPTIEFGCITNEEKVTYFVRDNGAGFNMALYKKLFKPFKRLHSESEFPGTGIGLAIVKRVVEKHGGKIWAQAQEGKGATFYFTLDFVPE